MAAQPFSFLHTFVLVASSFLVFTGCGIRTQTATLTGDFFNKSPEGIIVVSLARGNFLRETITLEDRKSQVIEGHWYIHGPSIELEPFVNIEQNTPVLHRQWKASAQYDLHGDLNWFMREDENVYFERVHPMTLALALTRQVLSTRTRICVLQRDLFGLRIFNKILKAAFVQPYTPA